MNQKQKAFLIKLKKQKPFNHYFIMTTYKKATPKKAEPKKPEPKTTSELVELGALWFKEGKQGKFMAGKITIDDQDIKIMVFKNEYKNADNHPDYKVVAVLENSTKNLEENDDLPF